MTTTTVQIRRDIEVREADDVSFHAGTVILDPERAATPDDVCVMIEIPVPADEDGSEPFRFAVPWAVALQISGRISTAIRDANVLRMAIADGDGA